MMFVACRNQKKGEEATERIKQGDSQANVKEMTLDLASFTSIRAFADQFKQLHIPLHILINNAYVYSSFQFFFYNPSSFILY